MPFVWNVTIRKTPQGYEYDPQQLEDVEVGDQVVWANDDDVAHWPGLVTSTGIVDTYFMANQIAPHSTSGAFVPGVAGTSTYVDSLDPQGPQGTIVVGS
jgi:plastocyanin